MPGALTERIDGSCRSVARVAAGLDARHAHLGVAATGPMQEQHGFVGRLVKLADDLANQDVDQALLGAGIGGWRVPCCRQIMGKPQEHRPIDPGPHRRCRAWILDPALQFGHAFQRTVPTRFKLAGSMALGRIRQVAASRSSGGIVSRPFQIPLDGSDDINRRSLSLVRSEDGGFHRPIRDRIEDLKGDRTIDPDAADANAQPRADMGVVTAALVTMSVAFPHAAEDAHHPAAPAAPHQAGQQGTATPC